MKYTTQIIAVTLVTSMLTTLSNAQLFTEQYSIIPDEPSSFDTYGDTISIDGGIIATSRSGSASAISLVYLYEESTGNLIRTLLPSDNEPNDLFGFSLVIKDGIVAVGAPSQNDARGAVYLFDAKTGIQINKLVANDAAPQNNFGTALAISNGLLAIGSGADNSNALFSGSVYIFDIATGNQLRKIFPNDGGIFGLFGRTVAMNGDTIAISAQGDNQTILHGAVYIFDATSGTQLHKLRPSDLAPQSADFGLSISLANGIVAAGSPSDNENGEDAGAAYLFDTITGDQIRKILPDKGITNGKFGFSVAIRNDLLAIGSINDIVNNQESGSVSLVEINSGTQYAKLIPSNPDDDHALGHSIALSEDSIAVGNPIGTGRREIFVYANIDCSSDLTGDGNLDFADISQFITLYGEFDPIADFNGDGNFDFFDISAYLAAFAAGCP